MMTVPASLEDAHVKEEATEEGEKRKGEKPLAANAKKSSVPKNHTDSHHSPSRMASVLVPMPSRSILHSPEKDKSKRRSPAPKNLSRHRVHSDFYERMAAQALAAATMTSTVLTESANEQPLDLSRKSSRPRSVSEPDPPPVSRKEGKRSGKQGSGGGEGGMSNGISSLQSLQNRFGGDFLMESPRRPSSIIPLQSTILPSKSILRPPPIPGNGLSHLSISAAAAATASAASSSHHHQQHQPHHHNHHHQGQNTSKPKSTGSSKGERLDKLSAFATTANATTTSKKSDKPQEASEASRKADNTPKSGKNGSATGVSSSSRKDDEDTGDNKYTIHRCSCQKSFGTLYALSAHLQETGHVPCSSKQASLMDYPKLVRGQDMWLNQESEQTRRILRCMQCGESFKSLPMLTVHMMQTQHYSKIVSAEHGRRSHKCSAYCDRELDKECIFKCKVCQETYTDMEGLANHMIVSGHHKKQILRSHNYSDLSMRHKHRKRFLSDEASGSTVASLLEYKRKYQGGSGGSNGYLSQVGRAGGSGSGSATPAPNDGFITCEVCGKKIEMQGFVDHIRLCLRQKAEVIDALKQKLAAEEGCSSKAAESSTQPDSKEDSLDTSEQPLPSTRDSALFKRLNSLTSASPDKDTDSVHKDNDSAEEKEEESRAMEMDVNKNESHDVAKIQTKDSDITSVKSKDSTDDSSQLPESLSKDAEESSSKPKKDENSPSEEDASEELLDKSKPSAKSPDHSPLHSDTEDKEQTETKMKSSSAPPRIPSPMTDEDNTSERSPCHSPQSGLSQSGDSRPPTPVATPLPSSPQPNPTPPPPQTPDSTKSCSQSQKREHESDEDGDNEAEEEDQDQEKNRKRKKIRVEEPERKRQKDAQEVECLRKKIKVEIPDDDEYFKKTPSPVSVPLTGTPSPKRSERSERNSGKALDQSLDIIDPNREESAKSSGSSALKAMESFIERSFSSKFDARRNAMSGFAALGGSGHLPIMGMSRMVPRSSPSPSTATSSMSYLSRFSKFFPLHAPSSSSSKYLDVAMDTPLPSFEKNVLSSLSAKSAELLEKTRNTERDFARHRVMISNGLTSKQSREMASKTKPSATATSRTAESDKEGGESDENKDAKKKDEEDSEMEEEGEKKDEDLATKYLNLDEEEKKEDKVESEEDLEEGPLAQPSTSSGSGSSSGKKSALDSLSSFVYGQPLTSEHPLDSLQKLLTKTSIPKMMSTAAAAGAFPHFNPLHYPYLTEQMMERMGFSPPDLPMASPPSTSAKPLNLSMKAWGGGSDEEDPDIHPDYDSPSTSRDLDDSNHGSPPVLGPDGELTEYKCAACSRRFASKGSYRYHLSRCHLSSVKKYGIKEAFNMSPYVYLPLDHTAKFTKYYQMAQELASKGK
ncbi:uncharacterized protein [Littorina saxatilis]|uniref:uncharacterized protein n=1 Tax=Littorina saxatilis TaxID=31220 RepID=UPI0038B527B2